jgi:hypothetical protein
MKISSVASTKLIALRNGKTKLFDATAFTS